MKNLILAPAYKNSVREAMFWKVTPPKRRAKKPIRKRQSLIWVYLLKWSKER